MHAINRIVNRRLFDQIIEQLIPSVFCYQKQLFGNKGDGGYVLPIDFLATGEYVVMSFGVNDDISFEEDILKFYPNTKVFCFDPTINALPIANKKISFFKTGLAGKNIKSKQLFTLETTMLHCGMKRTTKQILKVDIEGWEWDFLKDFDPQAYKADVIAIEFHFHLFKNWSTFLSFPFVFRKRHLLLNKLLKHYYVLHVHANNLSYQRIGNKMFPNLLEVTLIKKELFLNQIQNDISLYNSTNIPELADHQYPFILNDE